MPIKLPEIKGGWATVLCDPPWRFSQGLSSSPKVRGGAEKYYATMSDAEIIGLPVGEILAADAQVYCWATNAHLHRAFHCLESWGLEYKTCFTWVKGSVGGGSRPYATLMLQIGLGYWARGASEHMLLGVRGNPRAKFTGPNGATGLGISTVILAPRQAHSQKPDESYRVIEAISEEPRLEIFARRRRQGWTAFGDQVEGEVQTVLRPEN